MKKRVASCLLVALFAGVGFSQTTANLCGFVKDADGNPLGHTVVRLSQATYNNGYGNAPYLVETDATGKYKIGTGDCSVNTVTPNKGVSVNAFSPQYVGGKVLLSLPQATATVRMSIFTVSGRFVRDVMNKVLTQGDYSVSIDTRGISSQYYMLRVTINDVATVLRIYPSMHSTSGAIVHTSSDFQTRLKKVSAVVDTLRATLPGYTIGVTPITSLTGQVDFKLTKNTTWNGDTAAFWGSGYPVATTGVTYVILNRTNGVWADSQIYWSLNMNGTKTRLDKQATVPISGPGRFYVWIAPNDSNNRYFDFVEQSVSTGSIAGNNTTRVDGWRLPLAYRIHTATKNYDRGDDYKMFYQPRMAKFDEYKNEVPKEFTGMATVNYANIYAPHMTATNYFNTNGPYVGYFDAYQDSCRAHNTGVPAKTTAWNIFACAGPYGGSAIWGGNLNRHVGTLAQASWCDSTKFYKDYPCNYFSKWCHRRAMYNMQYGFPYDDHCEQSGIVGGVSGVQWFEIAIGW